MAFYHKCIRFSSFLPYKPNLFLISKRSFTNEILKQKVNIDNIDRMLFSIKQSHNFAYVANEFKEILDHNRLDHKQLVYATYIAHINYKNNQEFMQVALKKIENELAEKINEFPYDSRCTIIRNLMEATKKGYNLSNKELGKAILASIFIEKDKPKYSKLLFSVALMTHNFEALGLDYKSKFKELEPLLTPEFLDKLCLKDLSILLSAFKLYYQKIFHIGYRIVNPMPLFENSEKIILKSITNTTNANDLYWILFSYISLNTGTEDFIRHLESLILPRLHELTQFNFNGFPFLYKLRYSSDQKYIIYVIWKAYYEELINRFPKLSAKDMSVVIYRMWWSSSLHGFYCDSRLISLLQNFLNEERFILSLPERDGYELVTNISAFLTHAAFMDDENVVSRISDLLIKLQKGATDKLVMSSTNIMSRHLNVPNRFWDIFLERFPSVSRAGSHENDCYLFSIYLNVTLNNAEMKGKFEEIFKPILPRIIRNWKDSSTDSVSSKKQGYLHKIVEDILKKNEIKYEKEFYDDYYIDLALPDYKLAIEIEGPNHYIYPATKINGKTLNKIRNLEKKGWRVLQLAFYHYREYNIEQMIKECVRVCSPIKF
ncbi:unnamed protein product [Blepharisma stoltei]|uniref:RAP domain-containing protein n=1 Tax=Blepharisma stoltei TaxID=1481888 RepID=A0AAU9J9A0_9CILI|nr:unnamed protein product [Blepharisma stoltei]